MAHIVICLEPPISPDTLMNGQIYKAGECHPPPWSRNNTVSVNKLSDAPHRDCQEVTFMISFQPKCESSRGRGALGLLDTIMRSV